MKNDENEQLTQRWLATAEESFRNAERNLSETRAATFAAALKFRDYEYCRSQNLIGNGHPDYLGVRSEAERTAASLDLARKNLTAAETELAQAREAVMRREVEARREKAEAALKKRRPELFERLVAAECALAAATDPASATRPSQRPAGAMIYSAQERVKVARAAIDEAIAEMG